MRRYCTTGTRSPRTRCGAAWRRVPGWATAPTRSRHMPASRSDCGRRPVPSPPTARLQWAIGPGEPEALGELSRVAPEFFNAFPGVPKPVEWSAEVIPLRLADCFLKAVEAATDESPLVLVVDDIHAADNASAAILHMVARKLPRTRLLLILTGRTNELRTAAAPSALVSDTTVQALQGLELEPLSAEAAERLVTALAEGADAKIKVGDLPTSRILQAGNGNPLALQLLADEWVAHGPARVFRD